MTMLVLRILFSAVFITMLGVIIWASNRCALFDIPREVFTHPWFIATLLDAYFAFIAFWVWVAWKEGTVAARVLWLLTILLWGNPAVAGYMLLELSRVKSAGGKLDAVFTTKRPGAVALPGALTLLGIAVYVLGAKNVLFS
jgi:predicted permease